LKTLDSPFFTCKTHPNQATIYKCKQDGQYPCAFCMFEHLAHAQDNLEPYDEVNIFSAMKQKFEELLNFQTEIETFMKEVKQILNKMKKTDNIGLKAIFEKFE